MIKPIPMITCASVPASSEWYQRVRRHLQPVRRRWLVLIETLGRR